VGYWSSPEDIVANWAEDRRWVPQQGQQWRDRELRRWRKAVARSLDWVDADERAAAEGEGAAVTRAAGS
jgi:glycerol kinase